MLLAEAGTGTGKTLAYLAPAILSRRRVLVSTGTKNLQEQIFFKDLPVLREALGVQFSATCMKGRGNYLCLHRFEAFRTGGDPHMPGFGQSEYEVFVPIIADWARQTETGDRAEIEDLPEDLPFWSDIAATAENCLGSDCPRYNECFITRMRQRAAESDLVIVNHHLLCADAAVRQSSYGEVIPACHVAVIDEAHQLEDVATQYFGISVSSHRVEDFARDADQMLALRLARDEAADAKRAIDRVRDRARRFFGDVQFARRGVSAGDDRVRIRPGMLAEAAESAGLLAGALDALESHLALMKPAETAASGGTNHAEGRGVDDALALARRAGELRAQLAFVLRADDPDYVYYVELRGRGVYLRASPIDVSAIVRELLLDRMQATVLTSATLAVDGSFEYIRSRLGIGRAEEICLPSEFDYDRQAILYLPRHMPDPRSPQFAVAAAREILAILQRTRGRAFVLFTSYAMLRAVQPVAEQALDFPILVQGSAPRSTLLNQFRETPHSGPARHVELLAGRRRRRRGAQLRDHRQAAVRVALRPRHRGPHRVRSRRRRCAVQRLPGAPRHPHPAAGTRAAHPPPPRPRRARGARSPAADAPLRPALPGVDAGSAGDGRPRRDRRVFRGARIFGRPRRGVD